MARPKKVVSQEPAEGSIIAPDSVVMGSLNDEKEQEQIVVLEPLSGEEHKVLDIVQQDNMDQILTKEKDAVESLRELVRKVFSNRVRTNVPTLIEYRLKGSLVKKYVILDLDADAVREAWEQYKTTVENPDSEDFLLAVYYVTSHEIPRMYRNVIPYSLN